MKGDVHCCRQVSDDADGSARRCLTTITPYRAQRRRWMLSLYVCPSVRTSHAGIVSKRLNLGALKQCHTMVQGLWLSDARDCGETRGHPNGGVKCRLEEFTQIYGFESLRTDGQTYLGEGRKCVSLALGG